MNEQKYVIPNTRLSNNDIFSLNLYEKNGCNDLVEHVEMAITDTDKHFLPKKKNPILDTDLILPITNEFMNLLENYDVFKTLADKGYAFRENPRILTWHYSDSKKRGAAHHYHHDGWDIGGQVSIMLMLKSNKNATHMRLVENTRDGFFHRAYSKIIRFRHYNKIFPTIFRKAATALALKLIDFCLDMGNFKKLEGEKGTLFVFNTDQMHKAHAVKGTTRSMVHCNFVIDQSEKNKLMTGSKFDASKLGETSQKLCSSTNK